MTTANDDDDDCQSGEFSVPFPTDLQTGYKGDSDREHIKSNKKRLPAMY